MVFHYGSTCSQKIKELESHTVDLKRSLLEGARESAFRIHELKEQISRLKSESDARKCVLETCEEEMNKLSIENAKVSKEAKYWADLYADLTSKPLHPINEACSLDIPQDGSESKYPAKKRKKNHDKQ